jgi:dienelactone hydrolase
MIVPARRAPRRFVALALVVLLAFITACSPRWPHHHPKPGHTTWIETFVDTTRPTVPNAGPVLPSRTLETAIYRPNHRGPAPLIVFAHGLSGHPEKFTELFAAWADAGYVVAAPAFPLTNSHAPNPVANISDFAHQPGDLSFVLDQVLAMDRERGSRLFHAIDERRIGASGLSLGGLTTYLFVYGDCCRDDRIDAVQVLNGIQPGVTIDGHVPFFLGHSDTDPVLPYAGARTTYDRARSPVWFVTLHGASHASQWEDDVTPYDDIAERTTTDFWDGTLRGKNRAFDRLERHATVPGLSSIEHK